MPRNARDESNGYERYGLNREMEEVELGTAHDVAIKILRIVETHGALKSKDAITLVWNRFGGRYTYTHLMGWMGLRWDVLRALRELKRDHILYSGNSHCWRLRDHASVHVNRQRNG